MRFRFFVLLMLGLPALCTQSGLAQDSLNINMIGRVDFWDNANNLVPNGDLLYVAAGSSGLRILDVSDPEAPYEIGSFLTYGDAWDVKIVGDYAYVANEGMTVLDISDPTSPVMVDSLLYQSFGFGARCLAIQGDYVFVSGSQDLASVNISDPQNIVVDTTFNAVGSEVYDLALFGSYLYIGSSSWALEVYDVSSPSSPYQVGTCPETGYISGYTVVGDRLYVVSDEGFYILSLANPVQPIIMSHFDVMRYNDLSVENNLAYLAAGEQGLHILNISNPYDPFELGNSSNPNLYAYRIAQSNGVAYVSSYTWWTYNYDSSIYFFDVSSAFSPDEISSYNTGGFCRQATVKNQYAYMAGGSGGFVTLNVANPRNPFVEGQWDRFGGVSKVLIPGAFAFAAIDSFIVKFNIANPEYPFVIGSCTEGSTIEDFAISSDFAYAVTYPGDLEIYKIFVNNGHTGPYFTGRCNFNQSISRIAVSSSNFPVDTLLAYVTYYASNSDGIYVVDVTDPFNPSLLYTYSPSSLRFGALAVNGNYVYTSNSIGGSGLLYAINFQNPASPVLTTLTTGLDYVNDLFIQDNRLLVTCNYQGIYLYQFNSPTSVSLLGKYNTPFHAYSATMQGDTIYVADYEAFEILRYTQPQSIPFDDPQKLIPDKFSLLPPYPNPFNPTTTIRFGLPVASRVTLEVFDISGRNVTLSGSGTTPTTGFYPAGYHEIAFDGSTLASGIYICRIQAGDFTASQKLVLLK